MSVISTEVATAEVNEWLDYKKISATKRESLADQIEGMIEYVSDGILVINDDKTIKHVLNFQISDVVKEFTYRARLAMRDIKPCMVGVKATDAGGMTTAYIAALTNQPKAVIEALDTTDNSVAQTIAFFFI